MNKKALFSKEGLSELLTEGKEIFSKFEELRGFL